MTVGEFVKQFDMFEANIVIWHIEELNEKDENGRPIPTFQGFISDIPYWLTTCVLTEERIGTGKYKNKYGVEFGCIVIEVKDNE